MKLGLIAFEALTVAALIGVLRHLGRPLTRVAVYAWHPLPVWEIAGSGHVDIAMCALLIAGLLLVPARPHPACGVPSSRSGALIKPTALLALPVLWRPWNWRLPLDGDAHGGCSPTCPICRSAVACWATSAATSTRKGFDTGRGFALLWLMESYTGYLPAAVYVYATVAAAIMVGLADCRRLPQGPVGGDGGRLPELAARGVPGARVAALPLVLPRARSHARAQSARRPAGCSPWARRFSTTAPPARDGSAPTCALPCSRSHPSRPSPSMRGACGAPPSI